MKQKRTAAMAPIITPETRRLGVVPIFRTHIVDYQNQYPLWPQHRKIVYDLLNCRTPYLGGHIDRCDHCGAMRIAYHSCRNRHCPTCQHMPRERWLEQRKREILSTDYFHVVFTLPHALNPIVLNNKKVMLTILFKAAAQTLLTFGENTLGGKLGFIATLHTWDQKLNAHFHLHCLVAGGAVSPDGLRWTPCKGNYLFNARALSLVFRGKFMERMKQACQRQDLKLAGEDYNPLKARLYEKRWIVDVRDPVNNPQHVLEYLARYTHRVAIANSRIKALKDGMVTFTYKNRKKARMEALTITAVEFIRRFLLHSLPKRFVRIRHYGFLANRNRSANLAAIRRLMALPEPSEPPVATVEGIIRQLTGIDITVCPCCQKGSMHLFRKIPKGMARPPNPLIYAAA
jgi:hypothetical protein